MSEIVVSKAELVIEFVETLKLTGGATVGKPFILREWQKDFIYDVYGDLNINGTRKARTAILSMGRKNGKTELAAALCLAHLCGPLAAFNQQIYSAAADRYQAALIFRAMEAMIIADFELTDILRINRTNRHIFHDNSNSFYHALSADAKTKHGFNPVFIIYDELAQAPDRVLYDVLTTATGAQAEPLTLVISTQSASDTSILSELIDYGTKVNEGSVTDPTFKLFFYTVDDEADPWDEENWYLANPALNDFRSLEEMQQFASRAKRLPALETTFRNLYLNQRVNTTTHFLSPNVWKANAGELPYDELYDSLLGRVCYGGLDLSGKNDLTSLELAFPLEYDKYAVLSFFWTPGDMLVIKEDTDKAPYIAWERGGFLEAKPGKTIDYGWVAKKLGELAGIFDIQVVLFDRWRIDDFERECDALGVNVSLAPCGQGFKDMNPVIEIVEDLVSEQSLIHAMHPVLTWNASNVVIETSPAGDRKFNKEKSTGRIDGMVAMGMALRAATAERENFSSPYESQGLMVV